MKVLILGATGFIGLPVAQALVRAGHTVYGLARNESKAKMLATEEIIPVLGDVDSDAWIPLIATLDVVIEALGGGALDLKNVSPALLARVTESASSLRPADAPLLAYIYTSGTWVHGDDRKNIVTDTTPITRSVELVAWRSAVEQRVARSTAVHGIVVRPSLLYGRGGSILAPLFKAAAAGGVVSWPGTPGGRYSVIHADDLADFYVRVTEKSSLLGGKIFDASNPNTESVDELLQKVVEVSPATGYKYRKPENLFEEAVASSGLVRPYLGNALLGWTVKKPGLIDGLDVYYAASVASN